MTTSNWNPTNANTYLTLTWNRANTVLNTGALIQATLTLTAAANTGTLTTFSCDVTLPQAPINAKSLVRSPNLSLT